MASAMAVDGAEGGNSEHNTIYVNNLYEKVTQDGE